MFRWYFCRHLRDDVISGIRNPHLLFGFFYISGLLSVFGSGAPATENTNAETMLEYQLVEELPVGEYVGDIKRDFGLDQSLPVSTLSLLRFSFLTLPTVSGSGRRPDSGGGNTAVASYFSVDEKTSVIRTAERIDREQLCPRRPPDNSPATGIRTADDGACVVQFDVAIRPIDYFQIIRVRVEIVDINDHAPVFEPSALTVDIIESTDPGTSFQLSTDVSDQVIRCSRIVFY